MDCDSVLDVLGPQASLPERCKSATIPCVQNCRMLQKTRMLWLKAFHIVFVITWFAGLFYLPRLFVYHATASDPIGIERFEIMERRLFVMMTLGGALAAVFGMAMILAAPGLLAFAWLKVKLMLVAGLVGYHVWCHRLVLAFRRRTNRHSERWFRLFNEVPSLLLIAIVLLAVLKPS